jgi:hypothetical protein
MTLNRIATTAALLAIATLASAPASAQERDYKKRESARAAQEAAGRSGRGQERGGERAQPQRESPTPRNDAQAPRNEAPRAQDSPRVENPRGDVVGRAVPRSERPTVNNDGRNYQRHDNERHNYDGRDYDRRDYDRWDYDRGYYDRGYYDRDRRYGYSPRYVPRTYYRPYIFRPRLSIGFGIFAGYPVPYSYSYPYPIEVYGYRAPRAPVLVGPGSSYYGGVALEIGPYDADVFVDGSYVGKVEDFDGTSQPLTLVAGTHRIEVQAAGYAPLIFDVAVQPGQIIPYRGDLRPY